MTENHPITPPSNLLQQWIKECDRPDNPRWQEYEQDIANRAAQWGAEQAEADIERKLQKAADEKLIRVYQAAYQPAWKRGEHFGCHVDGLRAVLNLALWGRSSIEPTPTVRHLTIEDCSNMRKHAGNYIAEDFGGITLDGYFTREDLIEIANTVPTTEA